MRRFESLSRGAWIVVGVVLTLVLVPSGVALATAAYTGIEGNNGVTYKVNAAHVTSAGQLLTAPVAPSSYRVYGVGLSYAQGASGCATLGTVPKGDALVLEQVNAEFNVVDSATQFSFIGGTDNLSHAGVQIFASPASNTACQQTTTFVADVEAPGGTVGNVSIPLVPGFIVPSQYKITMDAAGVNGSLDVTGYLIPSTGITGPSSNGAIPLRGLLRRK